MIEFEIFTPNGRKRMSFVNVLLISWIAISALFFLFRYLSIDFISDKVFAISMFLLMFSVFFRAGIIRGKIRPLQGKLEGKLKFNESEIFENNQKIDLENLKKVDIHFGTYYSQYIYRSHAALYYPYRENGSDNWIAFKFNDDKEKKIYFQRMYEDQQKYLKPFFEYLHSKNLISFLRLTDILGINNYEEIQDYKKKIKN